MPCCAAGYLTQRITALSSGSILSAVNAGWNITAPGIVGPVARVKIGGNGIVTHAGNVRTASVIRAMGVAGSRRRMSISKTQQEGWV